MNLRARFVWLTTLLALLGPGLLAAQTAPNVPGAEADSASPQRLSLFEELGGSELPGFGNPANLPGVGTAEIQFTARFEMEQGTRRGMLFLTAELGPGWHTYSVSQLDGGTQRTAIAVTENPAFRVLGPFDPERKPEIKHYEYYPVPIEEHHGKVTWRAPLELAEGASPESLTIEGTVTGQVCSESGVCKPIGPLTWKAGFAGMYEGQTQARNLGEYRDKRSHAVIRGRLEPAQAAPGETVRLVLTAVSQPNWYVYELAPKKEKGRISNPTLIALRETSGWQAGAPIPSDPPKEKKNEDLPEEPVTRFHPGEVSWTIELKVPGNASPGKYPVSGLIGYHTCFDNGCDPAPAAAYFEVEVPVGESAEGGELPLAFSEATYREVQQAAEEGPAARTAATSLPDLSGLERLGTVGIFLAAFLAGMVLNVMPCVLPVIGLKIMSFVNQAGEQNRMQVWRLNLIYTAGILAVFMVMATLAVVLNLGWSSYFASTGFKISLAAVVFVFGLSMLGVWEIPIPGFVGTSKAGELAMQEGATGAFFKGVLSTVLATPCVGPFIVPAVNWAIAQPPLLTYATFFFLGLGMASPYLVIGANPALIKWLPRPGAWMEIFKQLMGFVLMATVVFLLYGLAKSDMLIGTLVLLLALGFACWLVGKIDVLWETRSKAAAWIGAAASVLLAWGLAFQAPAWFEQNELPWRDYTPVALEQGINEGKTVLVDFTADWCTTCKFNEATVLNTPDVAELVLSREIVTLKADKTHDNPEADRLLEHLGNASKGIPYYAIFPADGGPPVVLDGFLTKQRLFEAFEKAGATGTARAQTVLR